MNIKIYFVIIFILIIAGQNDFSKAFAEVPDKYVRKGLPFEMVISADELRELQEKKTYLVLLDARSEKSYEEGHIQGAILPLTPGYYEQAVLYKKGRLKQAPNGETALRDNLKKYSTDTLIVTYCSSGGCQASAVLALQIKRLGFKDVRAMEDGIQIWAEKGYPVTLGAKKENLRGATSKVEQACPDAQSSDCPDGVTIASRLG